MRQLSIYASKKEFDDTGDCRLAESYEEELIRWHWSAPKLTCIAFGANAG